jgi:tetratricopeptide (TPR) repeat protein
MADDTAGADGTDESGMDQSFAAALRAAESSPESDDAWDHVEELADKLQRPDAVADIYRTVLERRLAKDVFASVAERAVQFHEEWFGDTPEKISTLMSRIIELDPQADWAFERLTVMLTSTGQWDELLAVYDRILATTQDKERRRQLLNDAAQTAKDFASQADRAADYMQQLLVLEPKNKRLVTSLERLLEKSERWDDLIELWNARLPQLATKDKRAAQLAIVGLWIDKLNQSQRALDVLRILVTDNPGDADACSQAERILADDEVELSTRRQALSLLRKNYLVADRPEDVIRVLVRALEFIEPDERRPLHREAANRLAILGRDVEAIEHYRQLLLGDPTDADARKQLRQLARRSDRQDLQAKALVEAADATDESDQRSAVLIEAAHLHHTTLKDPNGAIELYSRVLNTDDAETSVALVAAHNLNELLAAADRSEERLAVLERLATLERSSAVRRFVLGEAARLADELGDPDRALASWKPVLESDEHDLEAMAAIIELLERNERWAELVAALRRRSAAKVMPLQRRTDLVRIAQVHEEKLEALPDAIDTWLEVREHFGENDETIAALDRLMSLADRHQELAALLGQAAGAEHSRASALLVRLGNIHREKLEDNDRALSWYRHALAIEPNSEGARTGLRALLDVKSGAAAEALARAYETTDDWEGVLEMLEPRLASAETAHMQARLLREAASIHLSRGEDAEAALTCLCRALPLEPDNLTTESQLMQLAQSTSGWAQAAVALRDAAVAVGDALARGAQLRKSEAAIHETWLDSLDHALEAYRAAADAHTVDPEAFESIARCGARARQWEIASNATVRSIALRGRIVKPVIGSLEAGAQSGDDWRLLATTLSAALAAKPLRPELGVQVELTIARWFRDHCEDLEAAELAAGRAVELVPTKLEALQMLAILQRRHGEPSLITTLLRLNRAVEQSLDPLYEAAQLVIDGEHDVSKTRNILEQLYRKAGGMWIRNEVAAGEQAPSDVAQWALDKLIEHHILNNDADRAVHVLMDGTRLPLETAKVVELRRRAAEMLVDRKQFGRAIDVYRGVLDEMPNDIDALQRVAELCEQEGRVSEALSLRLRELELIEDVDRRLQLRLDHSRLTGALEAQGGRVASLRANLEDAPGHEPSLDELTTVLAERGRFVELADIFAGQASKLEELEQADHAARLWTRVAALAEEKIADPERAMAAHARVVELASTNEALDALARLHLEHERPAEGARWLEQRLESTAEGDRVAVLLKLAHARIQADQREQAIQALGTAFEEAPRNAEVRKLLLGLYRSSKDWEALARMLTKGALAVADERTILSYAREAADIYHRRLGQPDASVPVLRRAVEIAEDDRELRAMLAEGLRVAGELDQAKELLEALVKDYGRRRSPERAQAHLQLARVTNAQGQTDEALDELEKASRMDASNVTILKELAELAREAGQLDRSERAYRTLLITVRREDEPEKLPIGPTEVLLELSRIATDRDDEAAANELVESALESLAKYDFEAPQLQAKLLEREEFALHERVLRRRLSFLKAPHKRAQAQADLGELLEKQARNDEALEARLEAVKTDPSSPIHHQGAWDCASRLNALDAYVGVVETLLSDERADSSAHVRCELLLRLGEVLEKEREDLKRAAEVYAQAESTGVRQVDVWRAQARVAGASGDSEEQMRLLERLTNLGEDQADTRADALYRLSEVQLSTPDTLSDGIASLTKALEDAFRAERAALILRRACEEHAENVALLDLYEQVARRSEDDHTLLHYLERRAFHADAMPEHAKEAVEKSLELEEGDRAEALMLRAAEVAQSLNRAEDLKRVDWAFLGLAERRMNAGDLASAVKWLSEGAEVAELSKVLELAQQVAELAGQPDGDLTLASKLYERLLESAPTERGAWEPLANIYARLNDVERLERMVEETLDGLQDPLDRNALRVILARALLTSDGRAEEAVELLQAVLVKDPQQLDAQTALVEHLERTGRTEELVQMLQQQLAAAKEREDGDGVRASSLALARRVEADDRMAALDVLREALRWAPDNAELLQALLSRLGEDDDVRERAELTESLVKVEPAETAGARALALVRLYESLEDEEGALRALQLGAERAPGDATIRSELQERYRARGDFHGLARTLADAAERAEEPSAKVGLWREAAVVHRDELGDAPTAAHLLGRAFELLPDDGELRIELAWTRSAAGEHQAAVATLNEAFEAADSDQGRFDLLRIRAELHSAAGDREAAVRDLEQAFEIDGPGIAPYLEAALTERLEAAAALGDEVAQREHTLRCVDVMLLQGHREQASELLGSWAQRSPDDVETLRRLRDIDTADGRWEAVATTCRRLVSIEEGAAQIDAALALSHAHHELGTPEGAKEGLEIARKQQPDSPQVRAELRKIYEHLGDMRQLASLLVDDAKEIEGIDEKVGLLLRAGQLYVELGDAGAAIPSLREAHELLPADPTVVTFLADAYNLAGWFEDALTLLDEVIAANKGRRTPEVSMYYHRKARVAAAQGDEPGQLTLLQEAHMCNKKNGQVAADLADLAEKLQQWDLASKTLRTITLIDTDCPITRAEAFLRQGRIARVQGDEKSAKMWARRAKREAPDWDEIDAFLQEMGERNSAAPRR